MSEVYEGYTRVVVHHWDDRSIVLAAAAIDPDDVSAPTLFVSSEYIETTDLAQRWADQLIDEKRRKIAHGVQSARFVCGDRVLEIEILGYQPLRLYEVADATAGRVPRLVWRFPTGLLA